MDLPTTFEPISGAVNRSKPLRLVRRCHTPTPPRYGCMLDNVVGVAGVVHRQPGSPLGVPHYRGPKLGIVWEKGFIGCTRQQCDEPQTLLGGNPQPAMLRQHVLVSAQAFGVRRGSAHHLTPPSHHISAVLITHRAAKQRCEEFFVFDEVVEPTQPALEGWPASGPLIDRGDLTAHATSRRLSAAAAMCTLPAHDSYSSRRTASDSTVGVRGTLGCAVWRGHAGRAGPRTAWRGPDGGGWRNLDRRRCRDHGKRSGTGPIAAPGLRRQRGAYRAARSPQRGGGRGRSLHRHWGIAVPWIGCSQRIGTADQ